MAQALALTAQLVATLALLVVPALALFLLSLVLRPATRGNADARHLSARQRLRFLRYLSALRLGRKTLWRNP
jgi:hypothetical protein